MTKQEFAQVIMALQVYYPRENLPKTEQAIDLWYDLLSDIPYQIAEASVKKWVATNKWSPSISEIRAMALNVTRGELKDWGQAWDDVMAAVREFGQSRAIEALKSLDELTREATKRIGFRNICNSDNLAADRANFRMIYEQLAKRKETSEQMPPRLRELIGNTQKALEG